MKYRFILSYKSTDSDEVVTRQVSPLYGDDPNVAIERVNDEWYYTRKLGGKFTFVREDYSWIMARQFDGTYTMTVECSTDGISWQEYFVGTFSRASLTIDEDNRNAVLDGLSEGTYNVIENAKDTEYDLRKVIPDTEAKEVQGEIWPALALVDYRSSSIGTSDIYCNGASVGGGYKESDSGYTEKVNVGTTSAWRLVKVWAEAEVKMENGYTSEAEGRYSGFVDYHTNSPASGGSVVSVDGELRNENGCRMFISVAPSSNNTLYADMYIYGSDGVGITGGLVSLGNNSTGYSSPASVAYTDFGTTHFDTVTIQFHYIRATLLTMWPLGAFFPLPVSNVLNVGPYYKFMRAFNNGDGGLEITASLNTSEQSNGHRLIAGTDLYFAPPEGEGWIPLAEDNWNYASLWYKITPSVANGLQDRSLMGTSRWTRCWTLGPVLRFLLDKISGGKVHFGEDEHYSQFLYAAVNPVAQGEQFEWLFCQKSDVMNPGGQNSTRCPARLNWFLEYMKNALNCYWWLKERNDGDYDFRVEHVEYFRRGNSYVQGDGSNLIDITKIKPLRNFPRNGQAAKRLSDQTNKYTFDLQGMAERYTFSWQGEGGSDEFKGNPMLFKAGWIEAGSSEDNQVDNIFADLSWLTLNAGTDTESSKNYEGLMVFAGYRKVTPVTAVTENAVMTERYLMIQQGSVFKVDMTLVVTVPEGQEFTVALVPALHGAQMLVGTYHGTGAVQSVRIVVDSHMSGLYTLRVDFGMGYGDVTLHRIHNNLTGNVYAVPNTESELTEGVYLQNGPLAWPSLQASYLHYDVPAQRWALNSDDPTDEATEWRDGGTVKLIKKQEVSELPVPDLATEQRLKEGIRTGLGTGILDSATVNLGSRNAEMTLVYDITPLVE
jgi:hypothetical protein